MTLEHIDRFSWIFWNYHFKSKENRHTIVLEHYLFSKFGSCRAQYVDCHLVFFSAYQYFLVHV